MCVFMAVWSVMWLVCVVHSWHMCLLGIYVCLTGADAYLDRLVWVVLMVCVSRRV